VRPLPLLAVVLAIATAACGSTASPHTPISFGLTGGNVIPYRVTIQPDGRVRVTGSTRAVRRRIAPARVRELRHEIQTAHLSSRRCPGVLPDLAAQYVRAGGRTVTVHGDCEAGFRRVWSDLTRAVLVLH
jgi:hypothetical protein